MKILDVDLFQDGLRRNIVMLDRLESEVEAIRRAVEGLVAMEDELKGQGGSAIRAFYAECHLPLLQQFLVSAAGYKQVLQQMENALYALEPDMSGHIVEQFLEGEVEQGLTTIAQLTENLTNESNSIMDQVSDIVALPHLDDSGVQEGVLDAKRKRDDTVSRLQEFDATQTAALLPFEQDMQAMDTWIRNMEEMFTSNLTDIHFQTDRWAELVACSPPLTISTPTIEGEMCLREEEEEKSFVDTSLEVVDGILSGLFDVGKDFVTGIVDIVQDPKATLDATLEAVTNPIETYNTIKSAITTSYERDMVNGDANSRAHWVTYALGTVATSIVGTKGVGALTKSGVTKAVAPKVVGAANNASDSLANLLPYGPRPQFAIAGEVHYNTVNAAGLRDQVISIARVVSGVKGIDNPTTRLPRTNGKWEGEPGNGKWYSDKPEVKNITNGEGLEFINGRPNFSPWSEGDIVFEKGKLTGTPNDFSLVYEKIQHQYNLPSKNAAKKLLKQAGVTPHHKSSTVIELIPTDLHGNIPHIGSASDLRGGY